jgi:hypothetical protein
VIGMPEKTSSWAALVWVVLIIGLVVAMMGYSTHLNWRYGREFFGGDEEIGALAFASGFALADGAKFVMAAQAAVYWSKRSVWASVGICMLALLGSLLSVTAMVNVGFQGAENSLAEVRAERQTMNELRARRDDLKRQIEELGTTVPPSMIEHQMQALRRDRRWQSTKGCTDVTAAASRSFCADHDRLFAELAAATKSKRLQAEVGKLSRVIRSLMTADSVVDPRRLMSIAAEWFGLEVDEVGLGQLLAFTIVVELFGVALSVVAGAQVASLRAGSGLQGVAGGSGAADATSAAQGHRQGKQNSRKRARRQVGCDPTSSDPVDAAGSDAGRYRLATPDQGAVIHCSDRTKRWTSSDTPSGIVPSARKTVASKGMEDACPIEFWDEYVVPAPGADIPAGELYEGYRIWSLRRGSKPFSQARFGKALTDDRGVQRRKSNGRKLYVDVALVL